MGDQVGATVSGALYYVPFKEFKRIRSLSVSPIDESILFSAFCRINTLYMIARAGSGHIGSSFSSMDILSWLHLHELRTPNETSGASPQDIFFSSKGHDAPGLYSTLIGLGKLDFELIHKLRRLNGLPGHPDISTPNIVTNTGSLGMGVSKAKGMVLANRLLKQSGNIYVLTGDGELQEGQFWESLISAANHNLHELTVIVDHNKLQSDTLVAKVSDLGDLKGKLEAFGWHVSRCDGNDLAAFSATLAAVKAINTKPKIIIADTIKGKGVSFMEHTSIDSDVEFYKFHSGAPTDEAYVKASQELIDTANATLRMLGAELLTLETVVRAAAVQPENPQRLIQAYSNALLEQARQNDLLVALDADLILDTGLIPFQKKFPDRFVECGIAEQDMVSQAGGMALKGLLPVVHSFACFLSARPNEQIYNNATEQTKIIYVGSLAGMVPGGPGHSHQAVRDVSALSAVPGLVMMEPSCEREVALLLDWAVNQNSASSYLRLVSLPWEINYTLPEHYLPELGKGVVLCDGVDIAIISAGPILLTEAMKVAQHFADLRAATIKVINMPWLNHIDALWLQKEVEGCRLIVTLDNHYLEGGLGKSVAHSLFNSSSGKRKLCTMGLKEIPACGVNSEILAHHGMDAESIVRQIEKSIGIV